MKPLPTLRLVSFGVVSSNRILVIRTECKVLMRNSSSAVHLWQLKTYERTISQFSTNCQFS
jgi:hypothetical protein